MRHHCVLTRRALLRTWGTGAREDVQDRTLCAFHAAVALESRSVLSDKAAEAAHRASDPGSMCPRAQETLRDTAWPVMPGTTLLPSALGWSMQRSTEPQGAWTRS